MPRGVHHPQPKLAQRDLLAISQRTKGVAHLGRLVQADLGPVPGRELPRAGHVIGVDVGVDHVAELEPALLEQPVVLIEGDGGIHHCRLVRLPEAMRYEAQPQRSSSICLKT